MKNDHRVNYTKHILKEALLELLKEQPIEKITIKQLCGIANISRATFYSHYVDIYALLTDIEKQILSQFQLDSFLIDTEHDRLPASLSMTNILTLVHKHAYFYKIFANQHVRGRYMSKVLSKLQSKITVVWMQNQVYSNQATAEYAFNFCKNGVMAIIQDWLNKDAKEREKPEEIGEIIKEIFASVHNLANHSEMDSNME